MASRGRAIVLIVALLMAGCSSATRSSEEDGSGDALARQAALEAVALEGALVEARDPTSVTLRWEGDLQSVVLAPDGTRILLSDEVLTQLTLPTGVFLSLEIALGTDGPDASVDVRDATGLERCDVAVGGMTSCITLFRLDSAAATSWELQVLSDGTTQPGSGFVLDVRVTLVEPAGGGLPALAAAVEGAPSPPAFRAPVMVADVPLHEPSIDIAPGGAIYVSGYGQEPGALWRSKDGGASFERLTPTDAPYCNNGVDSLIPVLATLPRAPGEDGTFHPGCGDIDVAVSGDEHVYFAHHWNGEAVHASHDGGATWTSSLLATPELRLTDRAWLAADGDRAWLAFNSGRRIVSGETGVAATGDTVVSRTEDGGLTWAQVGQTANLCIPGAFVHSPADDRLHLGGCSEEGPTVITSGDGGLTWETRLIAERAGDAGDRICYTCGIYTVLDVDDEGNLYAAWSDPHDAGTFDVWYASSTDQGATWSEPVVVNGAGGTHIMPWLVAGRAGHVALAWYGTAQEGDPSSVDRAVWYVHVAETTDALAAAPVFSERVASVVPVQYGPICLDGANCVGARNLGDYLQIAFDPQERPVVAFTDGRGGGAWNAVSRVMVATTTTTMAMKS